MTEFDIMAVLHQIIVGMTIAGFGGLFTYLWKMNTRMQKSEDHIVSLCNHMTKSEGDTDKIAEHDTEIKMLKVEITNIKLSMHDFRESMDKQFDVISDKLDRIRDSDRSPIKHDFRDRKR